MIYGMAIEVTKIYTQAGNPDIYSGTVSIGNTKVHELGIGAEKPLLDLREKDDKTIVAIGHEDGSVSIHNAEVKIVEHDPRLGALRTYAAGELLASLMPGDRAYTFFHKEDDDDIGGTVIVRNLGEEPHPVNRAKVGDEELPFLMGMN